MKLEHKVFAGEVKSFDDEQLILEHFISTETRDRGGDIMRADGMRIVGKPVVLQGHGHGPLGTEPIAKPLSIGKGEIAGQVGIVAQTQFFPDDTGKRLYAKAKGGWSPNWSIGYMVEEAKDLMENGHYAGREVLQWQLLEYSMVGVPMNPDAVGLGKASDGTATVQFKMMPTEDEEPAAPDVTPSPEAPEVETPTAEPEKEVEPDATEPDTAPATVEDQLTALELTVRELVQEIRGLKDIAAAVPEAPGEPAPSVEKDGSAADTNTPDPEPQRPRLVFAKAPAKALSADALREMMGKAVGARVQQELNRLRGKVP